MEFSVKDIDNDNLLSTIFMFTMPLKFINMTTEHRPQNIRPYNLTVELYHTKR